MVNLGCLCLCAAAIAACSTTGKGNQSSGTGGEGGAPSTGAVDVSGSTGSAAGCAEGAGSVYVLAMDKSLYRFDPPTFQFSLIGMINCPNEFGIPFSMAVA